MKLVTHPARAVLAAAFVLLGGFARLALAEEASAPTPPVAAPRPRMQLPEPADPKLPSLFLVGDSTVRNGFDDGQGKGADGQWGWGHTIVDLFDPTKINVVNRAVGGLSSRTYLTGGHWDRVLALLKPGDFVMMQLGTNDDGALNDEPPGPLRARGTIHGTGEETKEIDNVLTKKHEVVHTYGWYLRKIVTDTKARGATPIVCSLIPRKSWDADGRIKRNQDYAGWARDVAAQEHVGFVDLNEIVAAKHDALGHDAVMKLFPAPVTMPDGRVVDEHTHPNLAGAVLNAECVVSGLKGLKENPLAPFFSAKADAIAPYAPPPAFLAWAPTPPMGWNSWDGFATTVTEAQTKAQADVMAEKLARFGWNLVTVDIQWYEPDAKSFNYRKGAKLAMDEWGRLLPAANRFPSAVGGVGFKALADYVHAKGLKFGVHLLRGIPRQAVEQNTPIKNSAAHAADIADKVRVCKWNTDMFGVDMSKPGAQEYYDSVFALFAEWSVDFVKVDDLSRPYEQNRPEVEAIRRAIDHTGRAMVLSLSPGETPVAEGAHVAVHANQWRISDDFWDKWPALVEQFERLRKWAPFAGSGHWPDADMLPLGTLDLGKRRTRFTPDEQRTMLTLWSIARSPLILGADLTKLDDATLALVTNDEVIAVDQHSLNGRQLFAREGFIAWLADAPGAPDKYLALFNTNNAPAAVDGQATPPASARISLPLAELGFASGVRLRDVWAKAAGGEVHGEFAPEIPWHGAGLFRLSPLPK